MLSIRYLCIHRTTEWLLFQYCKLEEKFWAIFDNAYYVFQSNVERWIIILFMSYYRLIIPSLWNSKTESSWTNWAQIVQTRQQIEFIYCLVHLQIRNNEILSLNHADCIFISDYHILRYLLRYFFPPI